MNSQTLILRADASPTIGAGHVMRCLALAQAWIDRGGRAHFFSDGVADEIRSRILNEGMTLSETGFRSPAEMASRCSHAAAVVLDGARFDLREQKSWRDTGLITMVIDDNADLPEYDANLLLNHNPHALELDYSSRTHADLLIGPDFFLLRREFAAAPPPPDSGKEIRTILVNMGSSDPGNHCEIALRAIARSGLRAEVIILAGPANPRADALKKLAEDSPFPTHFLKSTPDMPALLVRADLALTAAGITSLELAAFGVPMLLFPTTPMQSTAAAFFHKNEMAVVLSPAECEHSDVAATKLLNIATDEALRKRLRRNSMRQVNKGGSFRVASCLADHINASKRISNTKVLP